MSSRTVTRLRRFGLSVWLEARFIGLAMFTPLPLEHPRVQRVIAAKMKLWREAYRDTKGDQRSDAT